MVTIWCRADYDGAVNVTIRENGMQSDVDFTLDPENARELADAIVRELVIWESGLW